MVTSTETHQTLTLGSLELSEPKDGRQAAAVYTERTREARATCTAQVARAAEAQAIHKSTDNKLYLHGIFVWDGVQIAKQRVWTWWRSLGESGAALAREHGFTVVIGVGKNSGGPMCLLVSELCGWKARITTKSWYGCGCLVERRKRL